MASKGARALILSFCHALTNSNARMAEMGAYETSSFDIVEIRRAGAANEWAEPPLALWRLLCSVGATGVPPSPLHPTARMFA